MRRDRHRFHNGTATPTPLRTTSHPGQLADIHVRAIVATPNPCLPPTFARSLVGGAKWPPGVTPQFKTTLVATLSTKSSKVTMALHRRKLLPCEVTSSHCVIFSGDASPCRSPRPEPLTAVMIRATKGPSHHLAAELVTAQCRSSWRTMWRKRTNSTRRICSRRPCCSDTDASDAAAVNTRPSSTNDRSPGVCRQARAASMMLAR